MSQPIQPALQHSPAIYKLSETIIEEIVCYLPVSCYPSLALVSKAFSPRFRHRRIDTGTAIVPLQALGPVWNNPTLATFVREVTIHESFFGPKIEDVWALEREPEHVRVAAEKEAWILKAGLLTNVLENATNLRRIIVLGFPTGLSGAMTRLIIEMCKTSIKTLDVVADAHFFDAMESLHDDLNSIRNLTLRLGEGLHLGTLVDPGAGPDADPESLHTDLKSLRNLKLRLEEGFHLGTLVNRGVGLHADPDVNSEIDGTVIYSRMLRMLKKFPRLRSIRFYKARVDHSAPALLKEIKTDFPDLCEVVFDACIGLSKALSISHVIDNLEGCLVFRPLGTLGLDDAPDKVPGVSEDLKTCVLETGPSDFYVESLVEAILLRTPHMQSFGFCYTDLLFLSSPFWTRLRDPIIQSLSAMRLRSLSLCGPRKMGIDQLERICDSIPTLVQFTVWVEGSAQDISKYAKFFSKLENLLVLQVIVAGEKSDACPCGHEEDPRAPHRDEGTGMNRLIRRFTPEHGPAVVRLQRKHFRGRANIMSPPIGREADKIKWIEHPADRSSNRDLALKKLEDEVGLFKDRAEAESKVFSASFWV